MVWLCRMAQWYIDSGVHCTYEYNARIMSNYFRWINNNNNEKKMNKIITGPPMYTGEREKNETIKCANEHWTVWLVRVQHKYAWVTVKRDTHTYVKKWKKEKKGEHQRSMQLNATKQWQINMIGKSNCLPMIARIHARQIVLWSVGQVCWCSQLLCEM